MNQNLYVSDQEASFLTLMARRVLNHTREAQKRGEEFHDMTRPVPLACGVRAKLVFREVAGGYEPEAHVVPHPGFVRDELALIASEILGGRKVELDEASLPTPPIQASIYKFKVKP